MRKRLVKDWLNLWRDYTQAGFLAAAGAGLPMAVLLCCGLTVGWAGFLSLTGFLFAFEFVSRDR